MFVFMLVKGFEFLDELLVEFCLIIVLINGNYRQIDRQIDNDLFIRYMYIFFFCFLGIDVIIIMNVIFFSVGI